MEPVQSPTQSPSPMPTATGEVHLSFYDALRKAAEGSKIHKLEWSDRDIYGFMDGPILKLHKPNGINDNWIISDGDMAGTDWVVL